VHRLAWLPFCKMYDLHLTPTAYRMTDERRFEELWAELNRIGVDPYSFPAGLTLKREDAIRVASTLPDGAGPTAFLAAIRNEQLRSRPISGEHSAISE